MVFENWTLMTLMTLMMTLMTLMTLMMKRNLTRWIDLVAKDAFLFCFISPSDVNRALLIWLV